ncbi:MAG: VWA domain-containing protein [bacterium]|nr:VWA domain-containing protein [bacterium]
MPRSFPRHLLGGVLILAGIVGSGGAWAEQEIAVSLDSPHPFQPVHGPVEVVAVVASEQQIERVAFYLDDVMVGELESPPYRLQIDVGQENREHRFQVVAYGVSGATGSTTLTTPSFRVDEEISIDLQQLFVTVSDQGQRVLDLERHDFTIFDQGQQQRIVTFSGGEVPFTAVVLVDASISMAGPNLRSALAGARAFFTGMHVLDEGKLLAFSDRILHTTPFTTFPGVLTAGLGQVRARGGTALNDHLYLALKRLDERQGRRVVVLLSDGADAHSVLSMTDVANKARRSQAMIYWLRVPHREGSGTAETQLPDLVSAWRRTEDYHREFELLWRTVEESGGRIRLLASIDEIEGAFREILAELREQYALGYYPPLLRHDGSWRKVEVRHRRQDLEVRCRDGYIDF